ncbi:hypothetical protein [Fulvivirga sp.]|uniref:hypothetical protein n=1 Tax=Fulvivirga sp. TaxID=1931237 RepID=UPI0032EBBCB4
MSWDLFVQNWGDVKTLDEIPDDFQPQPIGTRTKIIERIKEVEPTVNFKDESWGILENDQFSIEFNMGDDELLNSFAMHVRGNELAIPCIGNILKRLNLRATDGSTPEFFDTNNAIKSLKNWIEFRNKVLRNTGT